MFRLLDLPLEIRLMIYRSLRTTRSLRINHPGDNRSTASLGYASYGFYPHILTTNRQISHEAKQVFYGENYWTLYAGPDFYIKSIMFNLPPLSSALPYMRKIFIRFRLFSWLWLKCQAYHTDFAGDLSMNIKEICKVLHEAQSLQSVQFIWTETGPYWSPPSGAYADLPPWTSTSGDLVDQISWHIWGIIKPLKSLPPAVKITKGDVLALWQCQVRSTAMETAFGNVIDTVIQHHAASISGPRTA